MCGTRTQQMQPDKLNPSLLEEKSPSACCQPAPSRTTGLTPSNLVFQTQHQKHVTRSTPHQPGLHLDLVTFEGDEEHVEDDEEHVVPGHVHG